LLLCRYLHSSAAAEKSYDLTNVAELGCGMVAFTALSTDGLATDGHPRSVFNNCVNIKLSGGTGDARKLMWDDGPEGAQQCQELVNEFGAFTLLAVADCVHFQDFHSDLLCTICRMLKVGGKAVLVQPKRGDSLQSFFKVVSTLTTGSDPALTCDVASCESCDAEVWRSHQSCLKSCRQDYSEDCHLPVYVTLEIKREWREASDGVKVREQSAANKSSRDMQRCERINRNKEKMK